MSGQLAHLPRNPSASSYPELVLVRVVRWLVESADCVSCLTLLQFSCQNYVGYITMPLARETIGGQTINPSAMPTLGADQTVKT